MSYYFAAYGPFNRSKAYIETGTASMAGLLSDLDLALFDVDSQQAYTGLLR